MSDNRYSYMKPKKQVKKEPAKKKLNVMGILVTIAGIINLIVLIALIVNKANGNNIFFMSLSTLLWFACAVVLFVFKKEQ